MNKKKIKMICCVVSIILLTAFVIKTVINYFQYNPMANSAPFSVWILINALIFVLPALIIFIVGYIVGKKQ